MAEVSARYAFALLQSGQAQKEITHNSAIAAIDALLHLAVESRTLAAPPAGATSPASWIVCSVATGAWSGRAGQIAILDAGGWSFVVPRDGCLAYVRDEGVYAVCVGGVWNGAAWPVRALSVNGRTMLAVTPIALAGAAGGTIIDTEARAELAALTSAMRAMGLVAVA
ncbi:DUF2793 domain-containing protein [Polymorphobacter sp. PAMC 29334]|uniref:DUF2793 domain-containing protein n=1 Tax=Polymorphobacter sp. PAMC 29334 TaxID=2862331 RepID=UPI001C677FA5|nr:DUF2793 domain-containing protein [Polymorphobacter sp. PAMC 29334]QYE33705.1 DUF2793 domain-containing protein [Polymorphobacter sp. PAMC 29334]